MKLIIDIDEQTYDLLQEEQECGNYAITTELYRSVYKGQKIKSTEDVISRQAVIEWLKAKDIIKLSSQEEMARKELKALPSVNLQEPKTGHWIDTADEINAKYGKHDYKCSKCGEYAERFIAGTEDWWSCVKPNYCPSCGAAMTESEE